MKLLVFAHHTAVLDAIEAACQKSCRSVRIDGSTAPAVRQQAVDEFQNNRGCRLALLSITAAGVSALEHEYCLRLSQPKTYRHHGHAPPMGRAAPVLL